MIKDFFVFRNFTVEPLFDQVKDCRFSGYGEIDFPLGFRYYVWFYFLPFGKERTTMAKEIDFFRQRLSYVVSNIPPDSSLLCITMVNTDPFTYTIHDPVTKAINRYNGYIFQLAVGNRSIKVLDFTSFTSQYSLSELVDKRHFYMAQVPINPRLANSFKNWFKQKIHTLGGLRKKCLIVDLDNTLWGGILGEDGIAGIQLGNDYPGNCYRHFQMVIKEMKNNGVLLAICSKNNWEDVQQVIDQRDEMILKQDDFSSLKINWESKPENIKKITQELNIGLDSVVFIDDNPFEREQIRALLPEVVVPEFPSQPYQLFDFIKEVYNQWFQIYELTDEDKRKTEQYKENAKRKNFIARYDSSKSFLKAMQIKLIFYESFNLHLPRIAQMTQKTNQFNLTTKRYTETDLNNLMNCDYVVSDISVQDKFGDNGITAASIIKIKGSKAIIDTFLLSCRILGRGIETVFLNLILNRLFEKGVKMVFACFIPTDKNKQVGQFFENNGFELISIDAMGKKDYQLKLLKKREISKLYEVIVGQRGDIVNKF